MVVIINFQRYILFYYGALYPFVYIFQKPAEEKKPAWKVLRDDFMLGNSMKDWDKKDDKIPSKKIKVK